MLAEKSNQFPPMTSGAIVLLAKAMAGQCRGLIMAAELSRGTNDEARQQQANEMLEEHDALAASVNGVLFEVYGPEAGRTFSEVYAALADEGSRVSIDPLPIQVYEGLKLSPPVTVINSQEFDKDHEGGNSNGR